MTEGSAKRETQCAAGCDEKRALHGEWFCCWTTLEALARDAGALHEKCGGNCTLEELSQWRERVIAQVRETLVEEEQMFEQMRAAAQAEDGPQSPEQLMGSAA